MANSERDKVLRDLRVIPGVGEKLSIVLWNLGFRSVEELRGQDPEKMYARFCNQQGTLVDRCVLYVFRCAVYYASAPSHDPERLKWWNWKD